MRSRAALPKRAARIREVSRTALTKVVSAKATAVMSTIAIGASMSAANVH